MARKQRQPTEQVSCTLAEWAALDEFDSDTPFHCGPFVVHKRDSFYCVWVVYGQCGTIYRNQTMEQVCKGLRTPSPERLRGYYERLLAPKAEQKASGD